MELEEVSEKEYMEYINKLKHKDLNTLNYSEMSDLACNEIEEACNKEDWKQLKKGFRLLWLVTNLIEGKADATKTMLIKIARGDDLQKD